MNHLKIYKTTESVATNKSYKLPIRLRKILDTQDSHRVTFYSKEEAQKIRNNYRSNTVISINPEGLKSKA